MDIATWAAEAPASRDIAAAVLPDSEHVMEYHVVTRGTCWGAIVGEPPVRLEGGDIIVFPHGDPHVMSSAPGMRAQADAPELLRDARSTSVPFSLIYDAHRGPESITTAEDGSRSDAWCVVSSAAICGPSTH